MTRSFLPSTRNSLEGGVSLKDALSGKNKHSPNAKKNKGRVKRLKVNIAAKIPGMGPVLIGFSLISYRVAVGVGKAQTQPLGQGKVSGHLKGKSKSTGAGIVGACGLGL